MKTRDQAPSSTDQENHGLPVCELNVKEGLRAGMLCPRCQKGKIDYDGMLHLVCPTCGLTEAGACT